MDTKQLAQLTQNPQVRKFLDLVATTEGVKHGYNTGFGNTQLTSLVSHPKVMAAFKQTDGKTNKTSAAGRYQFLGSTWDDVSNKLGLRDFGPLSQDIAAVELMRRNGSLDKVLAGDFNGAVKLAGQTWASLPSSPYAQPKRSQKFVQETLAALDKKGPTTQAAAVASVPGAMADIVRELQQATPSATPFQDILPPTQGEAPLQNLISAPTAAASAPSWADQVANIQRTAVTDVQGDSPDESWNDQLMSDALAVDNDESRNAAVSQFFGEPVVPQLELPRSIDESINRYLAKLAS